MDLSELPMATQKQTCWLVCMDMCVDLSLHASDNDYLEGVACWFVCMKLLISH
jgi:hypothetical protein